MRVRAMVFAWLVAQGGAASAAALSSDPFAVCDRMIAATEVSQRLPPQLLHTIAMVESGRRNPRTGSFAPWPWTINAEGNGLFFDSRDQAVAGVRMLQDRGVRSIDVGCMQINLMYHPDAFASLEQAFDPQANVAYGAQFLRQLFGQTSAWPKAVAAYHSQTPEIGADYQRRVITLWPMAARYADPSVLIEPSSAFPRSSLPRRPPSELDRRLAAEAADRAVLYARMRLGPAAPVRPSRAGARLLLASSVAVPKHSLIRPTLTR